ncbi:MAG: hypothetical protein IJ600_08285 [Lachnospiraceae bacterium]|nr:hypothetical protein [Lachnospiraceae bacterium]
MSVDLRQGLYLISLNYIKKERYTGSNDGMRFMLEKKSEEGQEDKILVCTWSEPYSYEKTEEDKKNYRMFAFSEEGLKEAVAYLMGEQGNAD